MPDIHIPAGLLPSDGRFGSGPSKVRPEAIKALVKTGDTLLGTSHRRGQVRELVTRIRKGLTELFALPDGYEAVLGNGGTSAFWDSAAFCLVERRSEHLSFGEFSSRFAARVAAAPFLDDPLIIASNFGTHPEPSYDETVDVYALTHNETSTGVQMEIRRPTMDDGGPAPGLVIVDATSGAGGLPVEASEFDAYYFAPQKCFGSDGGMWCACLSPAALERIERLTADRFVPAFLDLKVAAENARQDYTLNTPAVVTLFLLENQLDWFNSNGGLEWSTGRCNRSAEIIYGWAERSTFASPFVSRAEDRSHVVATIDLHEPVDAEEVVRVLAANGILDTDPYRKLGRNQLRVALFPAIEPSDVEALTACVDYVVEHLSL